MPRISCKQEVLNRLDDLTVAAGKRAELSYLYGVPYDDIKQFVLTCRDYRRRIQCRRYLARGTYKKRTPKFHLFLETHHADSLSDKEFKFHFRVSREAFWELVLLLQNHEAFQRTSRKGRGPKPPSHQLLILLKYYGCEGNCASSIAISNFFGIGAGVVDGCRNKALEALMSLESQVYFWPTADERKAIASRIKEQYLFPNCVGLIDGTLLPLAYKPILHGENYLSRKKFYALVALVVCDDQARVLYYHVGWPGSVHDNRVWRNCKLHKDDTHFSGKESLLGDSAFTGSKRMVPPYKNPAGGELGNNHTNFNTLLAKPRVKSEHCIGMLKGRFPFLRSIRMKFGNRKQLKRIIQYVRGAIVLHNFLINEPIDADWIRGEDDGLLAVEPENTTDNDKGNYERREELLFYLSELPDTNIN